jgi:ADP-dependent NAD(P)H-hydrate dehydratase / NAD(P)H-hydrate epimerase
MRLVGSAEMREIDRTAIEGFGIPSLTLMDRAGRAVAEAAVQLAAPGGRFVVVCGPGNNGGDGFVAARLLRSAGRDARVLALVPAERLSPDARAVREQAQRAGVAIDDVGELAGVDAGVGDVVLDAIFGTGLARPPASAFAGAIARIEAARVAGARVLAVDVPSGLSADTGRPLGACVRADRTVTFAFQKRGLVLFPGASFAGEVTVADIGIPAEAARRVPVGCELLGDVEARLLVPPRAPDAHKGDAGRLLVVAGSPGKTGAAHLALTGALRGGVGLVTLAARPEVMPLALAGRPEAMSAPIPGAGALGRADLQALLALAKSADAIALGPGIPRGAETGELVRALLQRAGKPAVVDADGLNALADAPAAIAGIGVPLLLTPHPGEMARLCGTGIEAVQSDRIGVAAAKAREWHATVVLKGARTVVADPEGPPAVIPSGNPGMATGGTGDVLAGLCGALLAGGLAPSAAGRAGAFVHGRAGDLAARRFGERGLVAGDLGEAIGAVWAEWGR